MMRPCYLVVDQEYAGSISTRKLVIETAKLNVITAYSGAEAIETLERFPSVNGIVLDSAVHDVPCAELVRKLKALQPQAPVIVVGGPSHYDCGEADHFLESFDPKRLLELMGKLHREQISVIEKHNEELASSR